MVEVEVVIHGEVVVTKSQVVDDFANIIIAYKIILLIAVGRSLRL